MSSSDPPQLHLSLPSTAAPFKRSFEQFDFDLDPTNDPSTVAGSSAPNDHRPGPSNSDRNKRARSGSATPDFAEPARSADASPGSSSTSSHTMSSGATHQMPRTTGHSDVLPPPHVQPLHGLEQDVIFPSDLSFREEVTRSSSGMLDVQRSDTTPVDPAAPAAWSHPSSSNASSSDHNEQFRLSMERFHAFDSQISSIRSRRSPLPLPLPSSPPPTLPPLTLSPSVEREDSSSGSTAPLPPVGALRRSSLPASAQTPASPPHPGSTSVARVDAYVSPGGAEGFGEFREMMGIFPGRIPTPSNGSTPAVGSRRRSPSLPRGSERFLPDRRFRRSGLLQSAGAGAETDAGVESRPGGVSFHFWSSNRRDNSSGDDDDDDELGDDPAAAPLEVIRSLDRTRDHLETSLLASRLRRSAQGQSNNPAHNREGPLRLVSMPSVMSDSYATRTSRPQDPERSGHNELRPVQTSPRRTMIPETSRTLAERIGMRESGLTGELPTEHSRSPAAGAFSDSITPFDWVFDSPETPTVAQESPYGLVLPPRFSWYDPEPVPSAASRHTPRSQRGDSRQVPWRSSLSTDDLEDRVLAYLSHLDALPRVTDQPGHGRRITSLSDHRHSHIRTHRRNSNRDDVVDRSSMRPPVTESSAANAFDAATDWRRSLARAEFIHDLTNEREAGVTPTASVTFNDRSAAERPSISMREFIDRHLYLQRRSRSPSNDSGIRRPERVGVPLPEVHAPPENATAAIPASTEVNTFAQDDSDVPFSSHAAALFASRPPPPTAGTPSSRRATVADPDSPDILPYLPWGSRLEEDFAASSTRQRANPGERARRATPELERSGGNQRLGTSATTSASVSGSLPIDIDAFQHGPYRATLERATLERLERERHERQITLERHAEIDRLRSRLDELQSLERSITSSRPPALPPLRFERDPLVPEGSRRVSSPLPPARAASPSPFRADLDSVHRRRNWQRPTGARPYSLHEGNESFSWSTRMPPSAAPLPPARAHSPPHALPESRSARPTAEHPRERTHPIDTLALWGPDEPFDSFSSFPTTENNNFLSRLSRAHGEPPNAESQHPRREMREATWDREPAHSVSREPHVHADALRGLRPLWATQGPGAWGVAAHDGTPGHVSSAGPPPEALPRGRRRRPNPSALPTHGPTPEEERPPVARRASSMSRYASARRGVRDPLLERVQRMVRGGTRDSGFFGRLPRRNQGDFVRDEDFDNSYESLLSLAATIGEVRPRHTPDNVIATLPRATFKDWRNGESDQRCPICLDDYEDDDPVMKLSDCSHWLHTGCLQQWLRGATTCPVCRQRVRGPQPTARRERAGAQASEAQAGPSRDGDRSRRDAPPRAARERFPTLSLLRQARLNQPPYLGQGSSAGAGEAGSEANRAEPEPEFEEGDFDFTWVDWDLSGGQ